LEREFWRSVVLGLSTEEDAAVAVGVSVAVGSRWFSDGGGMPTLALSEPTGRYLSMAEREEIAVLRGQCSVREIGRRLGRPPSTISRELRRNATGGQPARYRATVAQADWRGTGSPDRAPTEILVGIRRRSGGWNTEEVLTAIPG